MRIFERIAVALGIIAFSAVIGTAEYWDCHYYRYGEVTEAVGHKLVIKDNCGDLWECDGEHLSKGDQIKMLMFTNYTNNTKYDDEIERVFLAND